jgi:multicomponent Na+:H+ antiporter subunit F
MTSAALLDYALILSLAILTLALLLCVYRVIVGPTMPDRVVALDMLVGIAIGYIAVFGIRTGFSLYVDVAISLSLVGFLATVAFARFILVQAQNTGTTPDNPPAKNSVDDKIAADQTRRTL